LVVLAEPALAQVPATGVVAEPDTCAFPVCNVEVET